jgi:DNA invertase Pin-like site-specific DNA recombinase
MALFGYCRVSRVDSAQTLDLQRDALIGAGVEPGHIYQDRGSLKCSDRPGLDSCLRALHAGDTLVIWKLDRLGTSLKHLVTTMKEFAERGIGFHVLTGAPINTSTKDGELIFAIFAGLAEFDRDLIVERAKTVYVRGHRDRGRKRKLTGSMVLLAQSVMRDRLTNTTQLAKKLGVTPTTLYKHIAPDGTLRAEGKKAVSQC